ncbi:hypothetical protein P153DRAFT_305804, partial [Dothidotthia symphoricarpi CBS 119687]
MRPSFLGKDKTLQRARYESQRQTADLVTQFRRAVDTRDIRQVMELYPTLLEARLLNRYDTRRIGQVLHVRIRNLKHASDLALPDLWPFVQQFVADTRSGALDPHPYAFVHLLGIYKDLKRFHDGHALWQWLVQQDESFVSQAAYGAAIELMAYGGLMRLPELEDLYADALKRFPGTFAEYHLSPDAIVADRTQPTFTTGLPTVLLQGILTARILARDWKRAYLALDTALRLYPAQTPMRFFELFLAERPVSEAYAALMLACRAGIVVRPKHVTALMTKLRAAMAESPSPADRLMVLRAIANALYAYLEAGGQLESIHVGSFLRAFDAVLPEQTPGQDYEGDAAQLRNTIVVAAHETLSGLLQAGMSPQIHPFDSLIAIAGRLRVPDLLLTTLQDINTARLELGPIGVRSVLTAAGLVGNKDLIEQFWSRVVSSAEAESRQIPFEDWTTLVKACRRANHVDYFKAQLLSLPHAITSSIERTITSQLSEKEVVPNMQSFEYPTTSELTSEMEALKTQMKSIQAVVMSGQPLDLRKSPFHMHLDPRHGQLGNDEAMRAVYEGFTTDPHQPPPPPPADGKAVLSPTGIPLDELRYQNWVTILEMMDQAQAYDTDIQAALDAAITAGKPLRNPSDILRLRPSSHTTTPLHDTAALRQKIKSLRAQGPAPLPFRKVTPRSPVDDVRSVNPPRASEHGALRLSYYVGLKSDHDAPVNPERNFFRGIKVG